MKSTELHKFKQKINKNPIEWEKLLKVIRYHITKFNVKFQMKS